MENNVRPGPPKPKRAAWTATQLENAVLAVQRKILSQREAAERYKVPRRTLRNHLKTGSVERKLGRTATLTVEQEEDLVGRILRLAAVGMPMTPKMVRRQAYEFCRLNGIPNNFNDTKSLAGKKWFTLFMKRHPNVSTRKAQMMNPARAQKLNKFIVNDHFEKVRNLRESLMIENRPECLYNMDEKGCRISLHHQQTVLAEKGAKRVHQITNEHAESVTVVGCVNAVGNAIPPMILFKGKRLKPEFTDNLPAGALVKMTEKGYMNHETFVEFIRHLAKYKTSGKCLLIFDGAASHLDFSIVDEAEKHDITLYCLPSNTTHELQPLDKSVYRSFEHHWDQELLRFVSMNPERKLNKTSFNMILSHVWPKCMTHDNIVNGFRATGLYPFDPAAIPETAFAPSVLSEYNDNTINVDSRASTSNSVPEQNQQRPNAISSSSSEVDSATRALNTASTSHSNPQPSQHGPVNFDSDSDTSSDDVPLSLIRTRAGKPAPTQSSPDSESRNAEVVFETNQPANTPIKSPFQTLIPTPKNSKININAPRRKALNYKGQEVTKDLFQSREKNTTVGTRGRGRTKTTTNDKRSQNSKVQRKKQPDAAGWFCHACREDKVMDMRQCKKCGTWYHEDCVGLTAEDEDFECPEVCPE